MFFQIFKACPACWLLPRIVEHVRATGGLWQTARARGQRAPTCGVRRAGARRQRARETPASTQAHMLSQSVRPRARPTWTSGVGGLAEDVLALGAECHSASSSGAGNRGIRHGRIQRGAPGSAGILDGSATPCHSTIGGRVSFYGTCPPAHIVAQTHRYHELCSNGGAPHSAAVAACALGRPLRSDSFRHSKIPTFRASSRAASTTGRATPTSTARAAAARVVPMPPR